ncbi:MAG: DUF559 domain-containing protein [Pseudomonadota bacterium]
MKRLALKAGTVERSRALRLNATDAEKMVWRALREAFPEAKFRRQVPLGSYFADFCSHSAKLVIEIDGGQHSETVDYDAARTSFINSEGYQVIRFWNNEVMENIEGVMARIQESLSPCGRG